MNSCARLTTFYTVRLTEARNAALSQVTRTERIQRFMMSLFEGDAAAGPAEDLRVVALLERGQREARSLDAEPLVQAQLHHTLGSIYHRLGSHERAETLLRAALEQRQRLLGADNPDVLDSQIALGLLRIDQAELDDAEQILRAAVDVGRRSLPTHTVLAQATGALGKVLQERGAYDDATKLLEEALRLHATAASPPTELGDTSPTWRTRISMLGEWMIRSH